MVSGQGKNREEWQFKGCVSALHRRMRTATGARQSTYGGNHSVLAITRTLCMWPTP